jgi:PAN domain
MNYDFYCRVIDNYALNFAICSIPDYFINGNASKWTHYIGTATRVVCRTLCTTVFDQQCSGFIYNSKNTSCVLSAFTGEWRDVANTLPCNSSGFMFYRRHRSTSTVKLFSIKFDMLEFVAALSRSVASYVFTIAIC